MNSNDADEASISAGFAPSFLAAVPFSQLATALVRVVGKRSGWQVVDDPNLGALAGSAVLMSSDGTRANVTLYVEPDGDHRVTGLQIGLVESNVPVTPTTFDASLRQLGPTVAFGLYEVTKGDCRLMHGVNDKQVMPIASTFKLWILAALGTEVLAGRASWDETVKVQRALISTPNGEIAAKPGTKVSLRGLAELMISVSDNSATDHLLNRVGRKKVEQAMRDAGVAAPERNIPMLSTREVFLIKRGAKVPAEAYLKLDTAGRRKALDTTLAGITWADDLRATQNTNRPAGIETIEWFASPLDQCRTQLRLANLASRQGLGPIVDILRQNPGTQFGPEWTDVRFKGGSEAGVFFLSWRLVAKDGRVFVMAGGVANPSGPVDQEQAVASIASGIRLVPAG